MGIRLKEALTNEIMRNYVSQNSFVTINEKEEYPQYSVTISDHYQNFCVGLVDMVDSTSIATRLKQAQIGTYYEIFLVIPFCHIVLDFLVKYKV